ncbi:hypothetical protein PR048_008751 [Dryococelus australis]|uniref:Reverse transcriptase domain-containing protein n=1 Tax=Dryococelus australis TaxID=614101 RepID=A0ABQ9HZT8_9NEOP|nr:hypothetical protein PR048_008751 [Dryococelus australis]
MPSEHALLLAKSFCTTFHPFWPPPGHSSSDLESVVFHPDESAVLFGSFLASPRDVARMVDGFALAKLPSVDGIFVRLLRALAHKSIFYIVPLIDTVFRLSVVDKVSASFCAHLQPALLLLDLERTFDSVLHGALLTKLCSSGFDECLLAALHHFLSGWSFQVRVAWVLSPSFPGSLLSPLLLVLYVADLTRLPGAVVFQYVDDNAVLLSWPHAPMLTVCIQESLRSLDMYFWHWWIWPNPENSELLFVTNCCVIPPLPPTFLGHQLFWQSIGHCLGVFLDSSFSLHYVHPLLVSSCPLSLDVCVGLWQCLVVPVLFRCCVWTYAPISSHHPLVSAYHCCLHILLGVSVFTVVDLLYHLCGVCPLSDVILEIAATFYRRASCHRNPLVAALGDYDVLDPHLHRRICDFLLDSTRLMM